MGEVIKLPSFELATLARGDPHAQKIAILLPGRLDTKEYACFPIHAEYLARRGFYAAAFDPPGTWESPGDIDLFTTTNYIKAVTELIAHFGNRPTLLMGHSRGAAVAILASVHAAVSGIVAVMASFGEPSAPGDEALQKGYKVSERDVPPGTSKTEEQKEFKLPIAYWIDGAQYSAEAVLKTCRKPKLLLYGDDDEFTPIDVVKRIFEEIPEPKMLKGLHSTHDYRYSSEAIRAVNAEVGTFLDAYFEPRSTS